MIRPFVGALGYSTTGFALGLIAQFAMARLFGVAGYGAVSMVLALIFVIGQLCDLGVGAALPRFCSQVHLRARDDWSATLMGAAVAMGISTLLFAPVVALAAHFMIIGGPEGRGGFNAELVIFAFSSYMAWRWSSGWLKGSDRGRQQVLLDATLTPTLVLSGLALSESWRGATVEDALLVHGIAWLVCSVFAGYLCRQDGIGPVELRAVWHSSIKLLRFGLPVAAAGLGSRVLRRADVLILGYVAGPGAAGWYRAAYTLVSGIKQVLAAINVQALYGIARGFGDQSERDAFSRYYQAVAATMTLAIIGYTTLVPLGEPLIRIGFGEGFEQSVRLLSTLAPGFFALCAVGPITTLLLAAGVTWGRFYVMMITGLLTCAAIWFAASRVELHLVGWVVSVMYLFTTITLICLAATLSGATQRPRLVKHALLVCAGFVFLSCMSLVWYPA